MTWKDYSKITDITSNASVKLYLVEDPIDEDGIFKITGDYIPENDIVKRYKIISNINEDPDVFAFVDISTESDLPKVKIVRKKGESLFKNNKIDADTLDRVYLDHIKAHMFERLENPPNVEYVSSDDDASDDENSNDESEVSHRSMPDDDREDEDRDRDDKSSESSAPVFENTDGDYYGPFECSIVKPNEVLDSVKGKYQVKFDNLGINLYSVIVNGVELVIEYDDMNPFILTGHENVCKKTNTIVCLNCGGKKKYAKDCDFCAGHSIFFYE
uniref:Uncharacterized protein n=1 Tax=viral metagenome TaxID=1070528 RepID=A0A6C0CKK1_9ZZZZ